MEWWGLEVRRDGVLLAEGLWRWVGGCSKIGGQN